MQVDYDVYKQKLLQSNMKRGLETFTWCQSSLFSMFIFIDSSCTKPNHFNTFYHDHKITCSQLTLIFFDKLDKCI